MAPEPPSEIPKYVVDGLDRQDPETLRAIVDYCRGRIEHLESSVSVEDADVADDEELVDVGDVERGTRVVKRVPCGKDCGGCPHGPYEYRVTRDGDGLNWEYLGPAESA